MIRCSDPACTAPGVKRQDDVWFCLFHPGRRPNIDSHTGLIRETPAERDAREKEARRVLAQAKKVKVIRPVKPRREIAKPDPALVVALYEQGHSIKTISESHRWSRRTVSKIVKDAGLLGKVLAFDPELLRADYLAGMPVKRIAQKHRTSTEKIAVLVADLDRPPIVGAQALPVDHDQILALYAADDRAKDVARQLGIGEKRVLRVLHAHGVVRPRTTHLNNQLKDTA